ncbi:MAG: 3-phosphoshikimate 1-carboxyvinyltransferase [Alphaproteobacteria bacterium]|nr:3-phosphoshikimate 1-carboxyvinyltransferase [Alphaproteobacteria bacterium]MBL6939666.1 3-phosphoshikimate 1-carboxyvinyltransferase [Alphaproteobacteria bacterium]MBL7097012.1 3-phosphoshikimate 1-carboxyvinyltransferase [Alphaproteobacteria bacterium]
MNANTLSRPLKSRRSSGLRGTALVPGDKSISHRALIFGALAVGQTEITGLLEAEDVLNTAEAMRAFGATVVRKGTGVWSVKGRGVGGWAEPSDVLDFGNSGTGSRLVMGAMATSPITAVFTGDASLRVRPMARVLDPLTEFGATYTARERGLMPVTVSGAKQPICVDHHVAVASAQVKSALLLAALNAPGRSRIAQSALTRDHTEKMLAAFGAEISVEPLDQGEAVFLTGEVELKPCAVDVPRDPSSAAFAMVAALIVSGSDIRIPAVLLNPRRTGLITTLIEMGGHILIENERESGGEKIGDLVVRSSALKGIEVPPERAPSMIDEYPILGVAAAFAEGRTVMRGLEELRVKESDRLAAIAAGLKANGLTTSETHDSLAIEGRGPDGVPGGARVATHMDHRIAMSFLAMGLASKEAVSVDDTAMIATSFPEFEKLMRDLGADFQQVNS